MHTLIAILIVQHNSVISNAHGHFNMKKFHPFSKYASNIAAETHSST
jgi:hypothetical protein